ncbi:phospholipid/cholesterol/gamma-HCH transport system permease protein [Rhodopseudomonas rhenobacensis]|uniref:Phospholipid/cholesterol/gamma-HCH transport system permease protein n=1 Tax=Rhodopseudomonas rhenobacensis TaxID=87461 RepID=A0A7W7Z3Y0_9BRAD|nr:ABC transporter permease [Rhodopseudomonas rhenobacensis]MBB5047575.1 phospholipid/cholesterol/gamma-HCH transport system permease protein [Rhodopseudomonas rhenobacensis]
MDGNPTLEQIARGNGLALCAAGSWTAPFAPVLERIVAEAEALSGTRPNISIDVSAVAKLDTFGAWLIERLRRSLTQGDAEATIAGLSANYSSLVDEVRRVKDPEPAQGGGLGLRAPVERLGRSVAGFVDTIVGLVAMAGAVMAAMLRVLLHPGSFRLTSTIHHLEQVCWRAVPIVMLITFLIGCIVAQQGIFHFRKFGADVFVVDMLGVLVLRELGVLLVAIMVAGRSGSAYTAELGSMKMREEIDALRTMGFDPIDVLIMPRMMALVLAMPILTFLGVVAALYGGGLVAWLYGGVDPDAFLLRLRDAISIDHFTVGMIKAPVMAIVIGIVACVEGLAVEGSAESLGRHTTASVVKGIFFVIVMDGVFAIFFASIGM